MTSRLPRRLGDRDPSRADWMELFFDLVFVALVGQLAHGLHEHPGFPAIGVFLSTACHGMPRMMWMPNFSPLRWMSSASFVAVSRDQAVSHEADGAPRESLVVFFAMIAEMRPGQDCSSMSPGPPPRRERQCTNINCRRRRIHPPVAQ